MARSGSDIFSTPSQYFSASTAKSSQNNSLSATHYNRTSSKFRLLTATLTCSTQLQDADTIQFLLTASLLRTIIYENKLTSVFFVLFPQGLSNFFSDQEKNDFGSFFFVNRTILMF